MGVLKRYLDALPDDARERVRTAEGWTTGLFSDSSGKRCLVGHAEDWPNSTMLVPKVRAVRMRLSRSPWEIPSRFDRLARRRGLTAAVALVKRHLEAAR